MITRPPVNARSGQPPPGPPRNGGGRQAVPPPRPVDEPPTPAPDVRTRFDEVDAALEELVTGTVAFNTPERMRYGDAQTITLIASPKLDPDALGEELRERIGGGDPITVESLKIAPLMEAQLEGAPAFDVTALTPVRQPVGRSAPTVWEWRVLAHAAGVHTLHLTINAIVTVDGERFPRSLNVLDRRITVEISTGQRVAMFVGTNWQWFAGSIVIPLAVWLWTMSRSGKPKRRR